MLGWKRGKGMYVSVDEMYAIAGVRGYWLPYYTGGKEPLPLATNPFTNFGHAEYICALHELMNHPNRS